MTTSGLFLSLVIPQYAFGGCEESWRFGTQLLKRVRQTKWEWDEKIISDIYTEGNIINARKSDDFSFLLCCSPTQTPKEERINKETGELSASGELFVCAELKGDKVEGSYRNPQLPRELREHLQALGIHKSSSPGHQTDVPLQQREELLAKVLPLYIQVL